MSNPVVKIRDTGRNSSRTGDVRELADNVITSATSTTTGTIAVTADATYDVSFTQPADTSIKNLIMIANGNLVTAGASGDDIDFDLGTAAGGGPETAEPHQRRDRASTGLLGTNRSTDAQEGPTATGEPRPGLLFRKRVLTASHC